MEGLEVDFSVSFTSISRLNASHMPKKCAFTVEPSIQASTKPQIYSLFET